MAARLDNQFSEQVSRCPDPGPTVKALFDRARQVNEQRFFLSIVDMSRLQGGDKPLLLADPRRYWIVDQFLDFLVETLVSPSDFDEEKQRTFVRRLHMLAYSQFWECLGIQRLLLSLILTICDREYDTDLLLGSKKRYTNSVYEEIISKARKDGLLFADAVECLYHNQIRNAIAHSEVWETSGFLLLENHVTGDEQSIPSVSFATWDTLFEKTKSFVEAVIVSRNEATRLLRSATPYKFSLPEFKREFTLVPDPRGGWTFER